MKLSKHIIGRVEFIEVVVGNGEPEIKLWKHRLAILSISGDQIVSKLYRKDDSALKKITENQDLLWSITPTETGEECIVSFLRKESVAGFMERLEKNNIHILDIWIGKNGLLDKEKRMADFLEKELNFSAIRRTPDRLNAVCDTIFYKLRLPVLFLFFFLLLANFFVNNYLRKEYEATQTELSLRRKSDKTQQENQKKWGRIQKEYQKTPHCSFALIADRIASYVPPTVQLTLLSVFPPEGNEKNRVTRDKVLKLKTGIIIVKGEVEIPGSVTLFSQFLSSDELFSKVEILSLSRQKDSDLFHFELLITL